MKYFSKFSILLLFAVFMFASSAMAAERYVAKTGSDGNDGSSGSPWLTIQHAITTSDAGDIINVAAGTYAEDLVIDKSLTLLGELDGTTRLTTIKGVLTEPVSAWALATPNIDIAADDVTISNFIIATPTMGASVYSSGIVINGTGVEISNNEFKMAGDPNEFNLAVAIQTRSVYALPGADLKGLKVVDNLFGTGTIGTAGYYGVFLNRDGENYSVEADIVLIEGNTFNG
jgi:pectin methylesterase-like acyl-CoA thioesterase